MEVEAVRVEAARLAVAVAVSAGTGAAAVVVVADRAAAVVAAAADAHTRLEVQEWKQFRDFELRNSEIKTLIP